MAENQVVSFFEEISKNKKLAEEVNKVVGEKISDEEKAKKLLSLAKEHNFNFTPKDVVNAGEKLSFDDLSEVSGGMFHALGAVGGAILSVFGFGNSGNVPQQQAQPPETEIVRSSGDIINSDEDSVPVELNPEAILQKVAMDEYLERGVPLPADFMSKLRNLGAGAVALAMAGGDAGTHATAIRRLLFRWSKVLDAGGKEGVLDAERVAELCDRFYTFRWDDVVVNSSDGRICMSMRKVKEALTLLQDMDAFVTETWQRYESALQDMVRDDRMSDEFLERINDLLANTQLSDFARAVRARGLIADIEGEADAPDTDSENQAANAPRGRADFDPDAILRTVEFNRSSDPNLPLPAEFMHNLRRLDNNSMLSFRNDQRVVNGVSIALYRWDLTLFALFQRGYFDPFRISGFGLRTKDFNNREMAAVQNGEPPMSDERFNEALTLLRDIDAYFSEVQEFYVSRFTFLSNSAILPDALRRDIKDLLNSDTMPAIARCLWARPLFSEVTSYLSSGAKFTDEWGNEVRYKFDFKTGTLYIDCVNSTTLLYGTTQAITGVLALFGGLDYSSPVKHLVIDANVKTIGPQAFAALDNLEDVTIRGRIEKIGSDAFFGCKNLETVTFEKGVEYMAEKVFEGCSKLQNVTGDIGLYGTNTFDRNCPFFTEKLSQRNNGAN